MRGVVTAVLITVAASFLAAAAMALLLPFPWSLVAVVVVGIVCLLALHVQLRRSLTSRLGRVLRTLRRAPDTNYAARCPTGADELGKLGAEINAILQRITELSVDVIDTDRELAWTQKELSFKEELANKGRLLQATNDQLENRLKELSQLFDVSRTLNSSLEMEPLMERFCEVGARTLELDRFAVCVWNERR